MRRDRPRAEYTKLDMIYDIIYFGTNENLKLYTIFARVKIVYYIQFALKRKGAYAPSLSAFAFALASRAALSAAIFFAFFSAASFALRFLAARWSA